MGKFAIECPKCGTINTASNFLLAKKVIKCGSCKEEISVKDSRLISKICPHCGKVFVLDQAKAKGKKCPACGEGIDIRKTATAVYKMETIHCPQCTCTIEIDKTKEVAFCPICDCQIDVKKEIAKSKLVNDTGISIIQYEGDNSTFVWKHPIEDFNLGSQLIVHESQEAIFFLNGEVLDSFGPGRHTLETENLPVLRKIYHLPTGNQPPFHAEVYFVNKTVQMGLKWGTDSRVRFIDPVTGIPLDIGASGELNMQVKDARKLVIKLVGTTGGLINKEVLEDVSNGTIHRTLQGYFRAPLMTEIKSYLASTIKMEKINILEIDEHMGRLSEALCKRISPKFEEYGLIIPQFYITTIALPEDDKNFKDIRSLISRAYIDVKAEEVKTSIAEATRQRKIVEEQTEAQLKVIKAQGEAEAKKAEAFAKAEGMRAEGLAQAEVMRAKGYTGKDEIDAEVQKAYAAGMGQLGGGNGGNGGGMASDLLGMMAQFKVAGTMLDKMDNAMSPWNGNTSNSSQTSKSAWTCTCGEKDNTKNFCMNCGKQKPGTVLSGVWNCPVCGKSGIDGKFCPECGTKKLEKEVWNCPVCGKSGIDGKFCPECGQKKS